MTRVVWTSIGLFNAAIWALFVVLSKRIVRSLDHVAVNLLVRCAAIVSFVIVGVPLTAAGAWHLDFDLSGPALAFMSMSAVVTWLIAFNSYYYALRHGQVSVVGPITSSDPVFTALYSFALLGTALGRFTIAGLVITMTGVVLLTRWMVERGQLEEPPAAEAVLPHGQTGDDVAMSNAAPSPPLSNARIAFFSILTALSWGLTPILIQAAINDLEGASITLLIASQALGVVVLLPLVAHRRARIALRPIGPRERRQLWLLICACGLIEALFSTLFYLMVEAVGPVLPTITVATSPAFAILGGIVLLKERPGPKLLTAAAITLVGVLIATLDRL